MITWTPEKEIKELINEIAEKEEAGIEIDMASLPSAEIPQGVDTMWPVWAMNEKGYCLVGDNAKDIEHISEVILAQQQMEYPELEEDISIDDNKDVFYAKEEWADQDIYIAFNVEDNKWYICVWSEHGGKYKNLWQAIKCIEESDWFSD